jgi:AraC-like DNA-binding protein
MDPATVDEMARAPVGRYVAGERFVHFCAAPNLWGVLLWGRPTIEDARQLGRSLVLELGPPAEPHVSLVDASRLEGADGGAFGALEWFLSRHGDTLSRQVLRLALVRPAGLVGAVVAGVYEVARRPYPVQVVDDVPLALSWLAESGERLGEPDTIAAMLAEVHARVSGTPAVVRSLRAALDAQVATIEIGGAARALGMSQRSLQRKLADQGTSFKEELAAARIRAAERLLLDTDAALTTIALEVGCASLQHFSAMFRAHTGQSPSAWRRGRRG